MTLSRKKQSIFDMTSENFGQLDQLVKFARDNDFSFNTEITLDTLLVIDNPVGIGNDSKKEAIKVQGLEFNNDYVGIADRPWILETGVWNSLGLWINTGLWNS